MLEENITKDSSPSTATDIRVDSSQKAKPGDDGDLSTPSQPRPVPKDNTVVTTDVTHERTHGEHSHNRHKAKRGKPPPPTEPMVCGPQLPTADVVCGPQLPTAADVVCGPQLPSAHDVVCGPELPIDGVLYGPLAMDAEPVAEKQKDHGGDSNFGADSKVSVLSEARFVRHRHLAEQDSSTEDGGHRGSQKHEWKKPVHKDSVGEEADIEAGPGSVEESEEDDFDDLDIIDKQLELALEKKKVGILTVKQELKMCLSR